MPRAPRNFQMLGQTAYAHEQAGVDFVREQLPDNLHARALIDMFDGSSGRHYEIDFIVVGFGALFVVEMKDYVGRIEGDTRTWELTRPGDSYPVLRKNPLPLTNHKCKVLRGKLEHWFKRNAPRRQVPFVQALVFLSNPAVDNRLRGEARSAVVTREQLIPALQHNQYPNANPRYWQPIDRPTRAALLQALDDIGLGKRQTQLKVNNYLLREVIADGPSYQDRWAQHEDGILRARARVYLEPEHTTVTERDRLRRAARREAQLLSSVTEHAGVLSVRDFVSDAPLGPTVLLESFDDGVPLDVFLAHEKPSFDERVDIFRQLGHALGYCHRREVIHGGVHPEAVLVARREGKPQIRLFNFQLGGGREASATVHRTLLISELARVYQAPELLIDPRAVSPATDCFGLGALGYLLFTGEAPAPDLFSLSQRLQRDRCLDPSAVADNLPDAVVETLCQATGLDDRLDDAVFIVENLVENLREEQRERDPSVEPESTAHVLAAERGDLLRERYEVLQILGQGASARVLLVKDGEDEREYALKVALDPEQNPRLELEADELKDFRHPRIVKLHDTLEFNDLCALKLSRAGEHTLHKQLTEEGALSLEDALRYGEDLLEALEQCEEHSVLHRDIKPANLGVGSVSRRTKHLTLFDFSLAGVPDDKLDVGTPPYRDPYLWLPERGRWDSAADRWSAAITLHEMVTALRPRFEPKGASPLDEGTRLVVVAERFDAALRDNLSAFFERALARELGERFDSARAMKRAWSASFDAQRRPKPAPVGSAPDAPGPEHVPDEGSSASPPESTEAEPAPPDRSRGAAACIEPGSLSDAQIAKIERNTKISALPLSARAVNALDRAGLTRAEELLGLPNNRLSAIRGIGTKVAREILDLRDRWRAMLETETGPEAEPFYPRYRGPELYLDAIGLPGLEALTLGDAGLRTTGVLSRAPKTQVEAILERAGCKPETVHEALAALERDQTTKAPDSLAAWIAALDIDSKRVADKRLRQLLGLEAPFVGRLDVAIRDLVVEAGVTAQALSRDLGKAIKRWRGQPWADPLRGLGLQVVEELGGVAPMPLAAAALRGLLSHDEAAPAELTLARSAALLRIAAELGADERERALSMHRRLRGPQGQQARPVLWLVSKAELWQLTLNLGDKADKLAQRTPLAASGEVERVLALVVENTDLSASELGRARLVELAAHASRHAAASSRLELYPLGMEPARAIELSAQALGKTALTPEEIARRVRGRYPDAAPLPARPQLDALLEPLRLRWDEAQGKYQRPAAPSSPSRASDQSSLHRARTQLSPPVRVRAGFSVPEEKLIAQEFEDELRMLVQDRKLRVLGVNAHHLLEAIDGLERALGVPALALDQRLISTMGEFVRARRGPVEILAKTDAAGPSDGNWAMLRKVAEQAASSLADELLPPEQGPLLLVQLGLLARYELRDFLNRIVDAAGDDRSEAIVLLNPVHAGERPELLANRVAIPGLLPGQVKHIPRPWLQNLHRGAVA